MSRINNYCLISEDASGEKTGFDGDNADVDDDEQWYEEF